MAEEKKIVKRPHNIILENRHTASISGVEDVESFDEACVVLSTDMGVLELRGIGLHINRLNVENGELSVEGDIESVMYSEVRPAKGGGLLSRLFK